MIPMLSFFAGYLGKGFINIVFSILRWFNVMPSLNKYKMKIFGLFTEKINELSLAYPHLFLFAAYVL